MKDTKTWGKIKEYIADFYQESIEIIPGTHFSQRQTIEKIEKYHAGIFLSGDIDSEGFKKFFFNISQSRCDVFAKAVDLDTKDLKIDADDKTRGWLMAKEVKVWARKNGFGKLANEIARVWPIYGTVVVKIVDGKPYVVKLRNLLNDQCAESLKDSWVIERHEYSPEEFSKMPWDKEEMKKVLDESKGESITVWECYWWEVNNGKVERVLYIVAGKQLDPNYALKKDENVSPAILFEKKNPEFPYKELHLSQQPGRWLAMGIVEKLFGVQERVNEIINRLAKIEHWASKQVFQTRDLLAQKNILTDAFDGDIIQVNSEITKIAVDDRNAPNMRQDLNTWLAQADRLAFSFETSTGESLPSNTPWRSVFLQQQVVASYFEVQRENFGLFLKDIFVDLIIPSFKKNNKSLHKMIVNGGGREMEMFRRAIAEEILRQNIDRVITKINTFEDLDAAVMDIEQRLGNSFAIEIPDSFYEDLEYWLDFVITKESVDTDAKLGSLNTAMQAIGANPALANNPAMRELFGAALSLGLGMEKANEIMGLLALNPIQQPEVAGSVAGTKATDIATMTADQAL